MSDPMSITTKTTPRTITLRCECGASKTFPNKGFGRIGAILFRQDHVCPQEEK